LTPKELGEDIVYITPGHAPSLVTSVGPAGNTNIGTFEQTILISYVPARILLAITEDSDTYKNIKDGSDCVVGFPRLEYIQQTYDAGVMLPRDKSELDVIRGITPFSSSHVGSIWSVGSIKTFPWETTTSYC
jgi:flavin reductase (DIM6/NTAB) family NADH-FMN oxidoreductase RutF